MIVLDSNVLSEVLRPTPATGIVAWLRKQPRAALFTTVISRSEILYGIRLLPEGQRRQGLWQAAQAIFNQDLSGQVLSFDSEAADFYAEIAALRKGIGRPISQFDAMIAAIARSRGASVATRNVKDFADCGVDIIDPWKA